MVKAYSPGFKLGLEAQQLGHDIGKRASNLVLATELLLGRKDLANAADHLKNIKAIGMQMGRHIEDFSRNMPPLRRSPTMADVSHGFEKSLGVAPGLFDTLEGLSNRLAFHVTALNASGSYGKDATKYVDILNRSHADIKSILDKAEGPVVPICLSSLASRALGDYAHRVKVKIGTNPVPKIAARERDFSRLFHNLFSNAIDADATEIACKVVSISKHLVIHVTDTGKGIPREVLHKIFDPRFTYGKKDGTGLGLDIVRKIAEKYGGHVMVTRTQTVGKRTGTHFTVSIPLAKNAVRGE